MNSWVDMNASKKVFSFEYKHRKFTRLLVFTHESRRCHNLEEHLRHYKRALNVIDEIRSFNAQLITCLVFRDNGYKT